MRLKHEFDLVISLLLFFSLLLFLNELLQVGLVQSKGLDFFARVRVINFIRRNAATAERGRNWEKLDFDYSDVQLLFPVIEDDRLLQHEFDGFDESAERQAMIESAQQEEPPEDLDALAQLLQRENIN